MALGVKAGQEEAGGVAAGDVVVGWINTATGQGGLDDYFLSGTVTCSDGAESCPDTTKGGEKNVEMLNSVSRDNYTMLTFRRPLKAEDRYDTTILTSQPQVSLSTSLISVLSGSFLVRWIQDGRKADEDKTFEECW